MKDVLSYESTQAADGTGLVKEDRKHYGELLDAKIDKYIEQLKNIEVKCSRPRVNQQDLLAEVTLLNDSMLAFCAEFEAAAKGDKALIENARVHFRERTAPILTKSYFMTHARTWPQDYQGDYKLLEGVYRNTPLSEGIGYYLDKYSLSSSLAVAVRERRATLRTLLTAELDSREKPNILDVACGSCREVLELASDIRRSDAIFTCVDFDGDALEFAANRMPALADNTKFCKYNAIKMINHERNVKQFGMQDVIYSVGFFDYLEDDVLVRLLQALFKLLTPGGKLITSFKDCRKYSSQHYHWMVNWDGFFQRTVEESKTILDKAGLPSETSTSLRDKSGVILFYITTK